MTPFRNQLLILTLLFGPLAARALPWDQSSDSGLRARTSVIVSDKQTKDPLIGATVTLRSGADTLLGVTSKRSDYFGLQARFDCDRIFRDSVSLDVSCLGYKTFSKRYAASDFSKYIRVELEIDEQSIAQVVVVGKRIAMVYRGDTTVYNAGAFKTMADDRLSEILRQLPGVEIKNNKIYADGEEIKRVYVDGRNLFGQQTSASLTDLRADDVRNVRVYEEQSAEAKHTGDNSALKEKVMDVETKSKRGVLFGGEISAMTGGSLEKDYSGRREIRHAEALQLFRHHAKGSMRLEASNKKDDGQRERASLGSKVTPSKQTEANLAYEFRRGDTTSVLTFASLSRSRQNSLNSTRTEYFATDEYALRNEQSRMESLTKDLAASVGNITSILRGKNSLGASFNFSYDQGITASNQNTHQTIDSEQLRTQLNSDGNSRSINFDVSLSYKFNLSERSSLSVYVGGDYSKQTRHDWRVDTVASTPGLRMALNSDGKGGRYSYNAQISYRYKTGEKSSFSAGYSFNRQYSQSEQRSIDYLNDPRGALDTVNSFDYTVDYYTNRLALSWEHTRDNFSCSANLWASMFDLVRDEHFPEKEHAPRRFFNLAPNIRFQFGKSKRRLSLHLGATPQAPSAEALRSTLNATNPLQLQAGNQDLKLPMNLSGDLRLHLGSAKSARSFSIAISGGYAFNYIASRRTLFLEETYLPQWDYTAQKGAQLSSQVNVGGNYRVGTNVSYSQQLVALRSTLRSELNYTFQQTPYFLGEMLRESDSHTLNLRIGFDTGFSTKVKISVTSTTAMSSYTTQQDTRHDLREQVNARLDLRFGKYFGYLGMFYEFYRNSSSKILTQHNIVLNAAAGRKFGKENRFSVSIGAMDLLSRPNFASTRFFTDYIQTSITSYLSRYAYLEASYTF